MTESERSKIMKHLKLAYCLCTMLLSYGAMAQGSFNFGYQTVFDANANDYLVSAVNMEQYSEGFSSATYWGPSANDVQASLTYEFNFGAPSSAISLTADVGVWNFVWGDANGYYGSGTGSASLWASVNGVSWQELFNVPTPSDSVSAGASYNNQSLPSSLLGSDSLWLQVDLEEDGAPIGDYADAQFSRNGSGGPPDVFDISVQTVPENSTLSLFGIGVAILAFASKGIKKSIA